MSANYWSSTQCRFWHFTKEQLTTMRQKLEDDNAELVRMFPLPQQRHLNIYFNQRMCLTTTYWINSIRLLTFSRRVDTVGQTTDDSTTIHGYSTGLHEAILLQSRDPTNEPIPCSSDRDIPCLQDRGVASAYPAHRHGG
jgi:hypothetical protein